MLPRCEHLRRLARVVVMGVVLVLAVAGPLVDEVKEPGSYSVQWDGKDDRGEFVSSGVYFYRMESGDFNSLKKMILLK